MASAIWKELEKRNLSGVKKVIQLYPNSVNFKGQVSSKETRVAWLHLLR